MLFLEAAAVEPVGELVEQLRAAVGERDGEGITGPRQERVAPAVSPQLDAHGLPVRARACVKAASVDDDQCIGRDAEMGRLRKPERSQLVGVNSQGATLR